MRIKSLKSNKVKNTEKWHWNGWITTSEWNRWEGAQKRHFFKLQTNDQEKALASGIWGRSYRKKWLYLVKKAQGTAEAFEGILYPFSNFPSPSMPISSWG